MAFTEPLGRPLKVALAVAAGRPERVPVALIPPAAKVTVPLGVKSLETIGVTVAVKVQLAQSPAWLAESDSVVGMRVVAAGRAPAADHTVAATATTAATARPRPATAARMHLVNPAPGFTPR